MTDETPIPGMTLHVDLTNSGQKPFVFRKAEWDVMIDGNDRMHSMRGEPGTWSRIEEFTGKHGRPSAWIAFACCPKCKQPSVLIKTIHTPDQFGKLPKDFRCTHGRCDFAAPAYLDEWSKKPLYAVAYERRNKTGQWLPHLEICHAKNAEEAKFHLGLPYGDYRIVAIGRAVGHTVYRRGEILGID